MLRYTSAITCATVTRDVTYPCLNWSYIFSLLDK